MKQIASEKGVELSSKLEGKQKSTLDRVAKLSGPEFDRAYMRTMVDDHKEDIEKFQREAEKGKDPAVKEFANKNLPILKKHLELAQATEKKVASGQRRNERKRKI